MNTQKLRNLEIIELSVKNQLRINNYTYINKFQLHIESMSDICCSL